jgi:hypothetical protein
MRDEAILRAEQPCRDGVAILRFNNRRNIRLVAALEGAAT